MTTSDAGGDRHRSWRRAERRSRPAPRRRGSRAANSASDDQDRREQIDGSRRSAVGDRRADGDRRAEREPDQRQLAGQRDQRRDDQRSASSHHGVRRCRRCRSGSIRPVDRGRQDDQRQRDGWRAAGRRARGSPCVSSHAVEIDSAAHTTPLFRWSALMRAHARPRNACPRRPRRHLAPRERPAGRHRMARERRARAL